MAGLRLLARQRNGGVMGNADGKRQLEDCIENYGMLSRLFRLEADKGLLQDMIDSAGAARARAAYPYESFFRTGSKVLGGEHCSEVSSAYRARAFMPTKTRIIAEDHIACELEFLQYLASLERDAVQDGDEVSAAKARRDSLAFLRSHLLSWIGDFRNEIEKHADTSFYLGLCEMTQGWLEIDEEALQESLDREGGCDD